MMDELERIRKKKIKELWERYVEKRKIEMNVDSNDFEKNVIELSKKIPVVVDFWAPWCMACKILTPILKRLVRCDGRFVLAKVNVEEARDLALKYGIMSIPAVKMFKYGKIVDGFVGALPEQAIKKWLNKNLGNEH